MTKNLREYYQNRAKEYDLVYQKPERQADLKKLHSFLKKAFENKKVFEIACGTGYWTKTIAQTCTSILATDINEEVLEIAKARDYPSRPVSFQELDLWQLTEATTLYDMVFGGFIWSHILKKDLPKFLTILQNQLTAKGELIFIDNKYVAGSNTPISRTDEEGNTYQVRQLQSGEKYEILKNFPSREKVDSFIKDIEFEIDWIELTYYWILKLKRSHRDPT